MRRAGPWVLAGALLLPAAACDDGPATDPTTPIGVTVRGDPPATRSAPGDAPTTATVTTAGPATAPRPIATTPTSVPVSDGAPPTSIVTRASFPDDAAAVAGIAADTFAYPGSPLTPAEAHCVADGLVHVFGRTRAAALGFGTGAWTLVGFALALGPWDRADGEAVVDTFRVCSPDWELLAISSSTPGAEEIGAGSARCVADELPDDAARELFVDALVRPPGSPEDELRVVSADLYRQCLTPAELAGLDGG